MIESSGRGGRSLRAHWRHLAVALVATIGIVGAATTAAAAAPTFDTQRIEFAPGTDRATRAGSVDPTHSDRWILNARAGQTMALNIDSIDDNTVFAVFTPDRQVLATVSSNTPEGETFWQGVLPASGDYSVEVASTGGTAYYALDVWIDAAVRQNIGLLQRLSFAPGTDSGTVGGSVLLGATDRWYLTASAGQLMDVSVTSVEANSTFDVFAPDGTAMTAPAERTTWSGPLPQNGGYRIDVSPTRGNATYTMTVRITGGAPSPQQTPQQTPQQQSPGQSVQRVNFAPGADHVEIRNSITPDVTHTFILGAAAGQVMTVLIDSDVGNITTSGFDPAGEPLWSDEYEITVDGLSSSGDYEVVVTNYAGIVGAYDLWIYIS